MAALHHDGYPFKKSFMMFKIILSVFWQIFSGNVDTVTPRRIDFDEELLAITLRLYIFSPRGQTCMKLAVIGCLYRSKFNYKDTPMRMIKKVVWSTQLSSHDVYHIHMILFILIFDRKKYVVRKEFVFGSSFEGSNYWTYVNKTTVTLLKIKCTYT